MGRKETTQKLSKYTEMLIDPHKDSRVYWAKEVTVDYGTNHSRRVDYMKFKPLNNSVSGIEKGNFYCYEIKSSLEDFNSPNGHNFIGDYNYYVMTRELWGKILINELPYGVGVYVLYENEGALVEIRRAKRRNREKPVSELLLMMFRSAARDRKTN